MDPEWIQEQYQTLKHQWRRPRDEELRKLGSLPQKGPRLIDLLARDHGVTLIADVDTGAHNLQERIQAYVNAGADAFLLTDSKVQSVEGMWNVVDFLKTRAQPAPTIQNTRILHAHQILMAAEAGIRTVVIAPEGLPFEVVEDLAHCANLAGVDIIFEIESEEQFLGIKPLNPQIVAINLDSILELTDILEEIPNTVYAIPLIPVDEVDDALQLMDAGADALILELPHLSAQALEHFIEDLRENAL